ncbi:hypothetical protein J0X19_15910 [Hymenobacter sp. BT186]|uniref:Uncharacterized protein n=1 Tax=Hymenobacter telluris TaxID=2816474 RepID=A0A939EZK9_9BACT|nr:hypothetical protein [Hymenobacter telluris]MBO0359450.1 hypothetical protein [Hymenobacter telluris]MBW3375476.1 hypothetical protein [Hymenobacter norwichensis]
MNPAFVSPCFACRRRIRWNGQPLFTDCSCVNYGRGTTTVALVAAATLVVGGLWWYLERKK